MKDMIEVIATYKSGRLEKHLVKKTSGPTNNALKKKVDSLRAFPTVKSVTVVDKNKEK